MYSLPAILPAIRPSDLKTSLALPSGPPPNLPAVEKQKGLM